MGLSTIRYKPIKDKYEPYERFYWDVRNKKQETLLIEKYDPPLNYRHRRYKKKESEKLRRKISKQIKLLELL